MFKREGIVKQAKKLVLFLADYLFPRDCVACGREGEWLCAKCRSQLNWLPAQVCLLCGADNKGQVCVSHNLFIDRFFSAYSYRETAVKELIKLCKYHFSREAGEILAGLLVDFLRAEDQQDILKLLNYWAKQNKLLVIAVPLSRRRYRWRGFNQSELLAKVVSAKLAWKFEKKSLIRTRHTKPQAELSAQIRRNNLLQAFVWRGESLADQVVLLIDDVATTGATLNESARALKIAGAKKVYGLTVAHG